MDTRKLAKEGATYAARQLDLVTHGQANVLLSRNAISSAQTWLCDRLQWLLEHITAPAAVDPAILDSCSLCSVLIAQWITFLSKFCSHAADFAQSLNHDRSQPFITQLKCGLSDPHDGGRTVLRARLDAFGIWYYKPRSGRQEHAWNRLLGQLNHCGFELDFLVSEIVPKADHCWMREIPYVSCSTRLEMERFYLRCGALLYLAHALRAVDLHRGNLVAHGEHPVLIDCETLLEPNVRIPPHAGNGRHGVSRTGMLPSGHVPNDGDPSFLGQKALRVAARAVGLGGIAARLTDGFTKMHYFLKQRATRERTQKMMKTLESEPVRCIYRPTYLYVQLLTESLRCYSMDEMTRRRWLESHLKNGLCNPTVVKREVEELLRCDLPIFYKRAATARACSSARDLLRACREIRNSLGR